MSRRLGEGVLDVVLPACPAMEPVRIPILDYKGTRINQYDKEGQALRTETTINNTRDFVSIT